MIKKDLYPQDQGAVRATDTDKSLADMLGFDERELQGFLDRHAAANASEEAQGSPIGVAVTVAVHC